MHLIVPILFAVFFVALAAYAHWLLPRYTAGKTRLRLTRAILIATGLAFGYVSATLSTTDPITRTLAFLIGFGVVHAPAAVVLYVKKARGSGKT